MTLPIEQHNLEIQSNLRAFEKRPLLQKIYDDLYSMLLPWLNTTDGAPVIDIGSGIGSIKRVIPDCITTDLFSNEWVDRVEDVYDLSFSDGEVGSVTMLHVFHHIEHPGSALREIARVLKPGGRLLIIDEYTRSLLGLLVYGLLHHEPIGLNHDVVWQRPEDIDEANDYFAAASNATKVFFSDRFEADIGEQWQLVTKQRFSAVSYILSGGFTKPQMYPTGMYSTVKAMERILDCLPPLFATSILAVLEKK